MAAKVKTGSIILRSRLGVQTLGAALQHRKAFAAESHANQLAAEKARDAWLATWLPETQAVVASPSTSGQEAARLSSMDLEFADMMCDLELLKTPREVFDNAKDIRLSDFVFHPADLFERQFLIPYLRKGSLNWTPLYDFETPISWNLDLLYGGRLMELFYDLFGWLAHEILQGCDNPPYYNVRWPTSIEHVAFQELAADFCLIRRGRGAPSGNRYVDGRQDAASCAWLIRHRTQCNKAEAVRRAVEKFEVIPPDIGEATRDQIIAISRPAAEKRVLELLDEIECGEPPF